MSEPENIIDFLLRVKERKVCGCFALDCVQHGAYSVKDYARFEALPEVVRVEINTLARYEKEKQKVPTGRVQKLERAVKECIMAIEGGTEINDHRGKVYQQQFGEDFLKHLKAALEMPPKISLRRSEYSLTRLGEYINETQPSKGIKYDRSQLQ
jgi:hypothetical protein